MDARLGNDVIYGGLGDDFLHGGAGDDAISGAEALREFYNEAPHTDVDPLRYDPATTKFAAYDAERSAGQDPRLLPQLRRLRHRRGRPVPC